MQKQVQPEAALRDLWNALGVPAERQEEILTALNELAKPGAKVGPFRIPTSEDDR